MPVRPRACRVVRKGPTEVGRGKRVGPGVAQAPGPAPGWEKLKSCDAQCSQQDSNSDMQSACPFAWCADFFFFRVRCRHRARIACPVPRRHCSYRWRWAHSAFGTSGAPKTWARIRGESGPAPGWEKRSPAGLCRVATASSDGTAIGVPAEGTDGNIGYANWV